MDQHLIRNINSNPQNEDEAVPKQWIEENFLNRNSPASTMARDLNMDTHHISYLGAPEQNHHAATKGYADTKLSLLGGSMQGLGWLETGFHTWASLFRAMTQSD